MGLKTVPATLKAKVLALKRWITSSKKRKSLATLTGILLIALAGQIVYSSFAATTAYSSNPEVAKMQKLTEEVVSMTDEYASMPDTISTKKGAAQPNTAKTTKQQELIAKVKERKAAYLIASQYDPQTTANSYLPYTTRDKLPTDAKLYTETAVDVQGVWMVGAIDNTNGARPLIKLQLDDGTRLTVYSGSLPSFSPGARVRITGIQIDHILNAALPYTPPVSQPQTTVKATPIRLLTPKVEAASSLCQNLLGPLTGKLCPDEDEDNNDSTAPPVTFCVPVGDPTRYASCTNDTHEPVTNENGGRKVLVVAFALPGEDGGIFSDGETYNIDEITKAYTDVQNAYSIMSYGKFRPDVKVWPEYTQIKEEDFGNYDDLSWKCGDYLYDSVEYAANKAMTRNANLRQAADDATDIAFLYNNIPCDGGTGRQGWAYVGVSTGEDGLPGLTNNILSGASLTKLTSTFAHEFGHSLGLEHTGAGCSQSSERCTDSQGTYGDIYNMMGGDVHEEYTSDSFLGDSVSFNAIQKQRLGWLDEGAIVTLPADSSKFETRLNALWQSGGTRGVEMSVGGDKYLVEYRPKTSQGIDNFTSGKMSDGILVYKLNAGSACADGNCSVDSLLMNGKKGEKYDTDDDYYKDRYKWDYTQAATTGAFMLKNDATGDTVCVNPYAITEGSIDLTIERSCETKSPDASPVSYIGREDNKFNQVWSLEDNDKITLLSSATGTCYDSKKNLLFAVAQGQVLVYKLKANGLPEDNKADWGFGARQVNETKRISGYSPPRYRLWTFISDAPEPKPAGTIGGSFQKVACDSEGSRLFVSDGYNYGRIKVFDYSAGLKDGMDPVAVLGQSSFNGQEILPPAPNSFKSNVADIAYSTRYRTLVVADTANYRILGFDLSGGVTNNMNASWVLGQANLSSANYDLSSVRTRQIAINDEDGKLYVSGAFGDSKNYSSLIRQYSIDKLKQSNQQQEAEVTFSNKEYPNSMVYDSKHKRLIVSVGAGDSISNRLTKTYNIEAGKVKQEAAQAVKWINSDDNGISTREGSGAWSFNSDQQVIYRTCVNSNGSFVCNHYEFFKAPKPGGDQYTRMRE